MSSRTLIIPDIHTDHEWIEDAIAAVTPEKVVFLGDYFDAPGATVSVQQKTADWLRHSLNQSNRVHLLGNHDVHYAFHGNQCAGYAECARSAILDILGKDWGGQLRLHHWEQGRLLTHAGVHPEIWPGTPDEFDSRCAEAMEALRTNRSNALLNCGSDRGGEGRSGILWLDFHWSFIPILGLPQVVGHTKCLANAEFVGKKCILNPELIEASDGTENWDLDTKCARLGLLANDRLSFIHNTWRPQREESGLKSLDTGFWDKEDL